MVTCLAALGHRRIEKVFVLFMVTWYSKDGLFT